MNDNRLMMLAEVIENTISKVDKELSKVSPNPTYLTSSVSMIQELVEEVITEMVLKHKLNKVREQHQLRAWEETQSQTWDLETQVIIELGYFLRFNEPSSKDIANAMCLGTIAEYFRFLLLPQISKLIVVYMERYCTNPDVDVLNKLHIMFGDDGWVHDKQGLVVSGMPIHPTLRSVISLGETDTSIYDIHLALKEAKRNLKHHLDDTIPDAKWYWDDLVEDTLKGWVALSMEVTEDEGITEDIDWTPQDEHEYLDEWYWDILASRVGWVPLDWETVSTWMIHSIRIHEMVRWAVHTDLGTRIKKDYFPDEQLEWQIGNR
jgi:hypothetical protein